MVLTRESRRAWWVIMITAWTAAAALILAHTLAMRDYIASARDHPARGRPMRAPLAFATFMPSFVRSLINVRSNCAIAAKVRDQSAGGVGIARVDALGRADQGHSVRVKLGDEPNQVGQAAAEPVELVDHHGFNRPAADQLHQLVQPGPASLGAGDRIGYFGGDRPAPAGGFGAKFTELGIVGLLVGRDPAVQAAFTPIPTNHERRAPRSIGNPIE